MSGPERAVATVLIVDASEESRAAFEQAFAGGGHEVRRLALGVAALELVTTQAFDAVFFDLDAPDIDGIEALRFMRALGSIAPLTFISSDRTSPELLQAARDGLGFDVLRRPLDAPTLRAVLGEMLDLP